MADVEVIIKIPEEKYNVIKSDLYNTFPTEMREWGLEAIRNGKPLSKPKIQMVQNPCVECGCNYCTNDDCDNRYIVDIAESEDKE